MWLDRQVRKEGETPATCGRDVNACQSRTLSQHRKRDTHEERKNLKENDKTRSWLV